MKLQNSCLYSMLAAVLALIVSFPASAGLKLCNATSSRIGVALGYQAKSGRTTEGWWNVGAQTCENLLKVPVPSRYIYVYAIDYERGGEWSGNLTMCVAENSFLIHQADNCEQRGYKTVNFYEVDTGDADNWTIRLADSDKSK